MTFAFLSKKKNSTQNKINTKKSIFRIDKMLSSAQKVNKITTNKSTLSFDKVCKKRVFIAGKHLKVNIQFSVTEMGKQSIL